MAAAKPSASLGSIPVPAKPARVLGAALILGLPLAAVVLYALHSCEHPAARYVRQPIERAQVVLFCCALGAFVARLWRMAGERRALSFDFVPAWDGRPVPGAERANGSEIIQTETQSTRLCRNDHIRIYDPVEARATGPGSFAMCRVGSFTAVPRP